MEGPHSHSFHCPDGPENVKMTYWAKRIYSLVPDGAPISKPFMSDGETEALCGIALGL